MFQVVSLVDPIQMTWLVDRVYWKHSEHWIVRAIFDDRDRLVRISYQASHRQLNGPVEMNTEKGRYLSLLSFLK